MILAKSRGQHGWAGYRPALATGSPADARKGLRLAVVRDGETVAFIQVRTEVDQVTLSYRRRNSGSEWKSDEYSVRLDCRPCTYDGWRRAERTEFGRSWTGSYAF